MTEEPELFEREAKILQQLDHPAIPKYIDYFQIETDSEVEFYIVQELACGQSLAHLISQGWIPDEKVVKDIAKQILEILVYLQQLTPPVIHRDIKPQNIIYQPDTGKLSLVDFGAVQDTYHHTVMGSTVVGTFGYMAPEQFRGGAVLSTDLYGLGCTILFLLTAQSPADLPQKKLKINFRKVVKVERNFANWIDKLIEPNINQRFAKANDALQVLLDKKSLAEYSSNLIVKPRYSSITVRQQESELIINIPPPYKRKKVDLAFYYWLGWSIISILNRIAIFISVIWIGKLYIFFWFYNVLFTKSKKTSLLTQGIFISIFSLMIAFGYNFSIPSFSIWLLVIDLLFDIVFKYNFVKQLLFTTEAIFCKDNSVTVIRKLLKSSHKEIFYNQRIKDLPKTFLMTAEEKWLLSEIEQFCS
ncbi:MAG: serine/threonine-protein kinase [Cyanobacteria bacterium P01_G01_bin.39]